MERLTILKAVEGISLVLLGLILTVLTQTGGIILIACLPLFSLINRKVLNKLKRRLLKPVLFVLIYLFTTFTLVPLLAKPFGRIPLPVFSNSRLKPLNLLTCLLNRHYVKPEMIRVMERVSVQMHEKYPGSAIAYLDACFPFIDGFPLIPHLSHNDGKKLDLAFFYLDSRTLAPLNREAPSFIGYGVWEEPGANEPDLPAGCARKGYWQYGIMEYMVPQWNKQDYLFDPGRTRELIELIAAEEPVGKIFIEPHLKLRMRLNSEKIRYHGCHAVRHDDHIHLQLK